MMSLSDAELQTVMSAAAPLQPHQRDQFLREVASELSRHLEIGPGIVSRTCSRLQRQHINAPQRRHGASKYDH